MKRLAFLLIIIVFLIACQKPGESPYSPDWQSVTNGNGERSSAETEASECRAEIRLDTDPCPLGWLWDSTEKCYFQTFDIVIREFGGVHVRLDKVEMIFHHLDESISVWTWRDLFLHCKNTDGTPGEVRIPGTYQFRKRFDEVIVTVEGVCAEGHSVNLSVIIYSWYVNPICYY